MDYYYVQLATIYQNFPSRGGGGGGNWPYEQIERQFNILYFIELRF